MRILAIETSCDETGVCILEAKGGLKKPTFNVLANITASQIPLHAKYGGVFPMMAKREHAKALTPLLLQTLREARLFSANEQFSINNLQKKKLEKLLEREPELLGALLKFLPTVKKPIIDAIAVTYGPGLEPTLWVGINFAKALSLVWNIPVIPINHMEGHIFSALLHEKGGKEFSIYNFQFPMIALLISGGHTELVFIKDWFKYKIIGETRDDAVGEAFDKVARMMGLPYPGGPYISALADISRTRADLTQINAEKIQLPRPMINSKDFDFSFSGLKTAVLYMLKKIPKLTDSVRADIAREFEDSVTEVLVTKTLSAMKKHKVHTLILGGGVAANDNIRSVMSKEVSEKFPGCAIYLPSKNLTGDNALMIAVAGYLRGISKKTKSVKKIRAEGNLRL